jgi:hypothetical protein
MMPGPDQFGGRPVATVERHRFRLLGKLSLSAHQLMLAR